MPCLACFPSEALAVCGRYPAFVVTDDPDRQAFEELLEREQGLVEAIWRQLIYGASLEAVVAHLEAPGVIDDSALGARVRELVSGAYRYIQRLEAEQARAANREVGA